MKIVFLAFVLFVFERSASGGVLDSLRLCFRKFQEISVLKKISKQWLKSPFLFKKNGKFYLKVSGSTTYPVEYWDEMGNPVILLSNPEQMKFNYYLTQNVSLTLEENKERELLEFNSTVLYRDPLKVGIVNSDDKGLCLTVEDGHHRFLKNDKLRGDLFVSVTYLKDDAAPKGTFFRRSRANP